MTISTSVRRPLAGLGVAAAVLVAVPAVASSPASAAGSLTCRASVSDSTPKQYSDVYVRVKTEARAKVRTVAHYKTTDTTHTGKANAKGVAHIKYYISGATAGYRVYVDVTVTKSGHSRSCSTSFVPHS